MINLLPPEIRSEYHYAHLNTRLIRWVLSGLGALLILGVIGQLGITYSQQTSRALDAQIDSINAAPEKQQLSKTKAQTKEISSNIKLAVDVLSKEILFSDLLQQLGKIMPKNTTLKDLNISQEQQGIDITAQADSYTTATQIQVNLTAPSSKLFQKADIINITCATKSEDAASTSASEDFDARYPCTVVIRALFVKNNPYLFSNKDTGQTKL